MSRLPLGHQLPVEFGRITLLERIGGGGMATVFRASLWGEGGFEKEVAVKLVRSELAEDPQFAEMFLEEAKLAARLDHANLVQTFDFGQVDGTQFLAMELVRGGTLACLLQASKEQGLPLGVVPSLFIAKELARGLDYAHRLQDSGGAPLQLIHRDVSPQNVLISREGEVKLADFGIAKAAQRSHLTLPGRVRGKCAYMAPEQARGEALDGRADVFALGVVLWESLTGSQLFCGDSDASTLLQVLEKEIPAPSALDAQIPAAVDELVLRLLQRDREQRPTSAEAAWMLGEQLLQIARRPAELKLAELLRHLLPPAPAAPTQPLTSPAPRGGGATAETVEGKEARGGKQEGQGPLGGIRARPLQWSLALLAVGLLLWLAGDGWLAPSERKAEPVVKRSGASSLQEEASSLGVGDGVDSEQRLVLAPAEEAKEEELRALGAGAGGEEMAAPPWTAEGPDFAAGPVAAGSVVAAEPGQGEGEAPAAGAGAILPSPTPRPAPTSSAPSRKVAAQPSSLLVLSSRSAGARAQVGEGAWMELSPHLPRSLELPAGRHRLRFRQGEGGKPCALTLQLLPEGQRSLLFSEGSVEELLAAERRSLGCE